MQFPKSTSGAAVPSRGVSTVASGPRAVPGSIALGPLLLRGADAHAAPFRGGPGVCPAAFDRNPGGVARHGISPSPRRATHHNPGGASAPRAYHHHHRNGKGITMADTAKNLYAKHLADIAGLFDLLQQELEVHEKSFADESGNWGFAGDLHKARDDLKELLMFLMGSQCEAEASAQIEEYLVGLREAVGGP